MNRESLASSGPLSPMSDEEELQEELQALPTFPGTRSSMCGLGTQNSRRRLQTIRDTTSINSVGDEDDDGNRTITGMGWYIKSTKHSFKGRPASDAEQSMLALDHARDQDQINDQDIQKHRRSAEAKISKPRSQRSSSLSSKPDIPKQNGRKIAFSSSISCTVVAEDSDESDQDSSKKTKKKTKAKK